MNVRHLLAGTDLAGTLVAVSLIVADVYLRASGHDARVFDEAIPTIVALYLGGRLAISAYNGGGSVPPASK